MTPSSCSTQPARSLKATLGEAAFSWLSPSAFGTDVNRCTEVCRATYAAQTRLRWHGTTCPKLANENQRLNPSPRLRLWWWNQTVREQADADSETEESSEAKTKKTNQAEEHADGRK